MNEKIKIEQRHFDALAYCAQRAMPTTAATIAEISVAIQGLRADNDRLRAALIKLREDAYNACADSSCNEAFAIADAAIGAGPMAIELPIAPHAIRIAHENPGKYVRYQIDFWSEGGEIQVSCDTVSMANDPAGSVMKCAVCGDEFDQSVLAQVVLHEHKGMSQVSATQGTITGRLSGKTYTQEQSTNVKEIGYEYKTNSLVVIYRNDKRYRYLGVPESVFKEACEVDSIGKFLAVAIKGTYRFEQISEV